MPGTVYFTIAYALLTLGSSLFIWGGRIEAGLCIGILALPLYIAATVKGFKRKFSPYIFTERPQFKKWTSEYVNPVVHVAFICFFWFVVELYLVASAMTWDQFQSTANGKILMVAIVSAFLSHLIVVAKLYTLKQQ